MELKNIISIVTFLLFVLYLFYAGYNRRSYLLFILFLLPVMDLNLTPINLGGFKVFDIISCLCGLMLLEKLKIKTNDLRFYFLLCCSFAGLVFLGSLVSEYVKVSLTEYVKFFTIFIYAALLLHELFANPAFSEQVIRALKFSLYISFGFLLIQLLIDPAFTFYLEEDMNINIKEGDFTRYPGFFNDPQKYAQFLAMISFLFLLSKDWKNKSSAFNYLFFILTALALFLTGGRSGVGGLLTGLLFVFLFAGRRYLLFAGVLGVIGLIVILYFADQLVIFNRGDYNEHFDFRYSVWVKAFNIFLEHPFLGIGIGNYQPYVTQYDPLQYWDIRGDIVYYDHPESGYLKILSEMGLFGFVMFMIFILKPIVSGLWFYLTRLRQVQILFLIAAILSWMVSFTTVYSISDVRVFLVLVSIICLLINACVNPNYKIVHAPAIQ